MITPSEIREQFQSIVIILKEIDRAWGYASTARLDEEFADYCVEFAGSIANADGYLDIAEVDGIRAVLGYEYWHERRFSPLFNNNDPRSLPFFLFAMVHLQKAYEASGKEAMLPQYFLGFIAAFGIHIIAVDLESDARECEVLAERMSFLRDVFSSQGILTTNPLNVVADIEDDLEDHCSLIATQEKPLDTLLQELHGLIGLEAIKRDIETLINIVRVRQLRDKHGLSLPPMSLHLVFSGNPGTGKTTVARLLASIYKALGVLTRGHLIEIDRSGLVGGFVGQTAIKTSEVIESAKGGVLFIDEAYSLVRSSDSSDYGREAVDTLLKAMEDSRADLIVIVAGYPELMEDFLESNPGLRSRFNRHIAFPDYDVNEMYKIFNSMCAEHSYNITRNAQARAYQLLGNLSAEKGKNFANGRTVRNVFEQTLANHANRVALITAPSKEQLSLLTSEDVPGCVSC